MLRIRVIPCLLLQNLALVKTRKFKDPKYIGDPINAVKIFNDKEVDELVFLDIRVSIEQLRPRVDLISRIASECFMPLCYGGGIRSLEDMEEIFNVGVEKVAINSHATENHVIIQKAAAVYGSQSVVVSIDVKKSAFGKYEVFAYGGRKNTKLDPVKYSQLVERMGAGEILLNSIDRDGTMRGYDVDLIKMVSNSVNIPVIACGGAGKIGDFADAVQRGNASAVAAGSLFVFHGRHRAVLISYPSYEKLQAVLDA